MLVSVFFSENICYENGTFMHCFPTDTGLTWVFSYLAVDNTSAVFHYVFVIFNASQGLLLFTLFTLREKKVPGL